MTVKDLGFKPMQLINLFLVETVGDQLVQAKTFNEICNFKVCALADDRVRNNWLAGIVAIDYVDKSRRRAIKHYANHPLKNIFASNTSSKQIDLEEMRTEASNIASYIATTRKVEKHPMFTFFTMNVYNYTCCIDCIAEYYESLTIGTEGSKCEKHRQACAICRNHWCELEEKKIVYQECAMTVSLCVKCAKMPQGGNLAKLTESFTLKRSMTSGGHAENLKRIQEHAGKKHVKKIPNDFYTTFNENYISRKQ